MTFQITRTKHPRSTSTHQDAGGAMAVVEYYLSGLRARRVGDVVGGARSKSSIGRTAVVGRCSQDFPSLGALCVGCCHIVVEQAGRATRYAHLRSSAKDYGRVAH